MASVKTPSPNILTFGGAGGWDFNMPFRGDTSQSVTAKDAGRAVPLWQSLFSCENPLPESFGRLTEQDLVTCLFPVTSESKKAVSLIWWEEGSASWKEGFGDDNWAGYPKICCTPLHMCCGFPLTCLPLPLDSQLSEGGTSVPVMYAPVVTSAIPGSANVY